MIDKLIGPITGLLDKFIPDADTKAKLAHSVATMAQEHAQELAKAQLEVNKVEAAHNSLFVAGWRPAVGWVCVLGMFGNFITIPFSNFVLALLELDIVIPLVPSGDHDACANGYAWSRCNENLRKKIRSV